MVQKHTKVQADFQGGGLVLTFFPMQVIMKCLRLSGARAFSFNLKLSMPSRHPQIVVRLRPEIDRSYPIVIEQGCLQRLPELIRPLAGSGKVFVITDTRVRRLYGRALLWRLTRVGTPSILIDFPPGEKSKNAGVLDILQTALLEGGVRRDSVVVALGGGVVGDVAGFAAATVLRGIPLVQVPTSLLAQVDSSVGGKVGINHPAGKNLLGAFHQPSAVYIDTAVLHTLPETEFRNGLGEVAKIAAALDPEFFRWLERHATEILPDKAVVLRDVIARAVSLKALVVEKDERDGGVRQSLNLGHTIGHALEAATGFTLRHGFAVAIGIAAEAAIAHRMGYMSGADLQRMLRLLRQLRLPTRVPRLRSRKRFFDALAADKKGVASGIRFTLPAGVGFCALGVEVPRTIIEEVTGIRE
jgi:3-dehydroquinate synthase